MKKKIISWLLIAWLVASWTWVALANKISTKEIKDEAIATSLDYFHSWELIDWYMIKDQNLLKILNENSEYMNWIFVSNDYWYNWDHFFTKKIETWEAIPEAVKKELKQVNLIISSEDYQFVHYYKSSDIDTHVNPISVDDKKINDIYERKIKFDYEPNKSYTFNLKDLVTKELNEEWYNYFNIQLELEFKNWEKIKIWQPTYLSIPTKIDIVRNIVSSNEKYQELYDFSMDRETIINFFDKKFKDLSNEDYLKKLTEIEKKVVEWWEKIKNDIFSKISKITTEEWFSNIQEEFFNSSIKASRYNDIEWAVQSKIRTLKTMIELEKFNF